MKKKEDKYKRLQFDFSIEAVTELEELVEISNSASKAEVVRKSLRIYEYLIRMAKSGYKIELSNNDKRESLSPILLI